MQRLQERLMTSTRPICRSRYRGTGTDLSKVPAFKRHEEDCGSTEVQIARISARVLQLTSHLKEHRKDYAATRGLVKLLGQRRRLMTYIYQESRYAPRSCLRRHCCKILVSTVETKVASDPLLAACLQPGATQLHLHSLIAVIAACKVQIGK